MPTGAEPFGTVRDRAVYLPNTDTLVAADLHLGKAAASPVDAPLDAGPDIVDGLGELLDRFEPAEVVVAGDVLHAFGSVHRAARTALESLIERVDGAGATLTLLEGNHDAQLAELVDTPPTGSRRLADGTVVCHGHERPRVSGPRYVVGHDHPAIVIDGRRRPCYLHGPGVYDDADVLGLPAFNPAVRGTAINTWVDGDPLSPFLQRISRFRPVVWDDAGDLVFPALGSLRAYL